MSLPFSDPVLIFASVMVLILLAPLLARRCRLPEIIGLLLAGMVVGPHGLNILARDQTIELLGAVGLLFIMFLAGLEIDLNQVRRNRAPTLVFGLLTFAVPLALGILLGRQVFGMSVPVAVLLASMFSSHTLLTFPMAGRLGLAKSPATTTAIGGTIITDTLALLILAVIAGSVHGELNALFWTRLLLLMAVYVVGVFFLVPLLSRWFFRRITADENLEFVFVLALTFTCAWLAHLAGLEPIIGAFLAGLTLNPLIPERSLLMTRIHFTGEVLFIPFFLISVGMLVDLSLLLAGSATWIIAIGMTSVALLAKFLAAAATQKLLGLQRDEGWLIFGLSVNQAAATLAAALVGYNLGLFSEAVITGTIMMIAVTCLAGSVVTERAGRSVALREEQAQFDPLAAAHRIMIPLEVGEERRQLLDIALLLREKGAHEPLFPLRVVAESGDSEQQVFAAERILAGTVVRITAAGVPVMPVTAVDVNATAGILRSMKDYRISLVVFGWKGRSNSRVRTFGRVIDAVIERSSHMVMVNRVTQPINTVRRIVLLLPPFATRDIGFDNFIKTIKILANQTASPLLVLCAPETISASEDFIRNVRPATPVSFEAYLSWKNVLYSVRELLQDNDWLVMMSARRGELAWQPSLERLPAQLARAFPALPLSVVLAPVERWDTPQSDASQALLGALFKPGLTRWNIEGESIDEVLDAILACHHGAWARNEPERAEVVRALRREPAVELVPDVVLLHTYVPQVRKSTVFLGVANRPLDIRLPSGPPRVVIVFLDPVGHDPAQHLRILADLSKLLMRPDFVPLLRQVTGYEELVSRMQAEG
ncbi:cation:proton antiporter [Desulfuromonas sp. CSMB_57]|jgi:Kef-type K+ transport system membrane component KefB/mannitol/fructose-specific phosphotransferase system IIA component (Ntr-type)|uniref:cation:proton antiporter domain-containing protein n=1 Tax=Desulfuromonas sp. CSMB_57 TaxID=2807629 RepID=UPI001CD1F5F4|nr:cation:proton antiporter [Desulfuromonas sp. CSMB_57]